jgi:CRP-like cAMP-binding protein
MKKQVPTEASPPMDPVASHRPLLARSHPLQQLDAPQLDELLRGCKPRTHARGQTLLRRSEASPAVYTYLIAGRAELRRSFFDRVTLDAGDGEALQPLEMLLPAEGGQIVAQEECQTLQLSRDRLDRALAANSSADFSVAMLSDSDLSEEFLVSDGAVEVDWMSRFLQSPLANHLPAMVIQQLLACLQSRDVARGETIVRRGEPGEALYLLTRGVALVHTDPEGAFGGRDFSLIPGDYFGEESLVAETVRNATVVMEADGTVAQLDRNAFDELIRPHLIPQLAVDAVAGGELLLDVRFPVEFRRRAREGSRNLPISVLRASLQELSAERRILVTPEGGRRSELAVFLLRQAGFDAWLLQGEVD